MSQLEPPYPLIRDGLSQGKVIPFLGSGASLGKRNPNETPWNEKAEFLPTATELATYLVNKTNFPQDESTELAKVAQYYNVVGGRDPLDDALHNIFDRDYPLTSLHTLLADITVPLLIVTTNYDDLIERAFRFKGRPYDVIIHTIDTAFADRLLWYCHSEHEPVEIIPNKLDIDLGSVTVIYKMHGAVDRRDPARDQYVITEDDYIDFLTRMTRRRAVPAIFAEPFQTRHFLFLGYSLRDWNLRVVLNRIEKDLGRRKEIKSWAIQHKPSPLEQRFWQERGVEVYNMTLEEFVNQLYSL
jgi:hypothetical protein